MLRNPFLSQSSVQVQITLPKVSLINAIWWSSYFKDDRNGYILYFGQISYTVPGNPECNTEIISQNQIFR